MIVPAAKGGRPAVVPLIANGIAAAGQFMELRLVRIHDIENGTWPMPAGEPAQEHIAIVEIDTAAGAGALVGYQHVIGHMKFTRRGFESRTSWRTGWSAEPRDERIYGTDAAQEGVESWSTYSGTTRATVRSASSESAKR